MNVDLKDKQILITGGTSGLGQAFVAKAVSEGATVYFTYFQNQQKADELTRLGAYAFCADLTKRSDILTLKKTILSRTPYLDAMIHNAAIVRDRTIGNLPEEAWDEVLSVNLDAVYFLTKQFVRLLLKKRGSKILNIVSRVGFGGGFGEANYAASKAGLVALTKSLARELGKKQICVNGLNPGFMETKMTRSMPEAAFKRNINESVLNRTSNPESVSQFMVYLLSDKVQSVSGQIFHFDSRPVVTW